MTTTHQRYTGVFGFNTKQWWVYDEDDDVYIDPPVSVLRKIKTQNNNHEIEQKRLEKIANKKHEKNLITLLIFENPCAMMFTRLGHARCPAAMQWTVIKGYSVTDCE